MNYCKYGLQLLQGDLSKRFRYLRCCKSSRCKKVNWQGHIHWTALEATNHWRRCLWHTRTTYLFYANRHLTIYILFLLADTYNTCTLTMRHTIFLGRSTDLLSEIYIYLFLAKIKINIGRLDQTYRLANSSTSDLTGERLDRRHHYFVFFV